MAAQKPWADSPFKLIEIASFTQNRENPHIAVHLAHDMAHAHNLLLRGLNAIYNQALHIPSDPSTIKDFLFYCQTWYKVTAHHHEGEEKFFFPGVEALAGKPGLMEGNLQQHEAFHPGFHAFNTYVSSTLASNPSEYSGTELQRIIDSFAPAFTQHLTDEIGTLLALDDLDEEGLKKTWGEAEAFALEVDKYTNYPFLFSTLDYTYEGGVHRGKFPPVPWFVPYLVKYWYARRYAGSWRFGPCDGVGGRRGLEFVG